MLHIPYISMPLALYLLLRLIHRSAEAVIYFLMYAIFIFVPYKTWNIVNCRLKKMTGLPVILIPLTVLLPS